MSQMLVIFQPAITQRNRYDANSRWHHQHWGYVPRHGAIARQGLMVERI